MGFRQDQCAVYVPLYDCRLHVLKAFNNYPSQFELSTTAQPDLKFLILSQTSLGFYVSAVVDFWQHRGKRKNCSIRAISPLPPTVFSTRLEEFLAIVMKFKIVVCKLFEFGPVRNISSIQNSFFNPHLFCCLKMLPMSPKICRSVVGKPLPHNVE